MNEKANVFGLFVLTPEIDGAELEFRLVAEAGSEEFVSNGIDVLAPDIPNRVPLTVDPEAENVIDILTEERAAEETAYHISRLQVIEPLSIVCEPVAWRLNHVSPPPETLETVGAAVGAEFNVSMIRIMTSFAFDVEKELKINDDPLVEFQTVPSIASAIARHLSEDQDSVTVVAVVNSGVTPDVTAILGEIVPK